MADILLVSAGEDVRLWSMPSLDFHSVRSNGNNPSVKYCACSNNGQMIAFTHEGQGINISLLEESTQPNFIPTACEQSNAAFSSNSRYIVSGGKDCMVNVWDVKSRAVKRTYQSHVNPITFCIFNYNGNVIASSSSSDEIILTDVQSGLSCNPLVSGDSQSINCINYSHFTRYLLGSVSNSGSLSLWDTKESKLIKTFNEHNAPSTSLSFSPLNDMLLCSTGLDKRIIFYDVNLKKSVKTMNVEGPLTCCDFLHDGTTVAVGSVSGHLYLYDLRHGSTPIQVVLAHRTSVKTLSFQKFLTKDRQTKVFDERTKTADMICENRNDKEILDEKEIRSSINRHGISVKKSVSLNRINEISYSGGRNESYPDRISSSLIDDNIKMVKNLSGSEFFSPIPVDLSLRGRKPEKQLKSNMKKLEMKPQVLYAEEEITKPVYTRSKSGLSKLLLLNKSTDDLSNMGKSTENFDNLMNTKKQKGKSTEDLHKKSKLETDKVLKDSKKVGLSGFRSPFRKRIQDKHSDDSDTSSLDSMHMEDKNFSYRGNKKYNISDTGQSTAVEKIRKTSETSGRSSPSKKYIDHREALNDAQNSGGVTSNLLRSPSINSSDTVSLKSETYVDGNNEGALATPFPVDFIQNMIDEAIEENKMAMHSSMVNLHSEFLRQMEIQKYEIRNILQEQSRNNELVDEIHRLREELALLRFKY